MPPNTDHPDVSVYEAYATLPPLSRTEQNALIRRWQQTHDEEAIDLLCRTNMRFVVRIASEYLRQGPETLVELTAIGAMGLLEGANRFDPERGYRFISYAVWWIRQAIQKHLKDLAPTIRLPVNIHADLSKLAKTHAKKEQQLGRSLSLYELAEANDQISEPTRQALPYWESGGRTMAMDQADDEDHLSPHEFLADSQAVDPLEAAHTQQQAALIREQIARLDPRSQKILVAYFGLDGEPACTLEAIGRSMGITRERVRQIKERALDTIRSRVPQSALAEVVAL